MDLVPPSAEYEASYLAAVREFRAEGRGKELYDDAEKDFPAFVERVSNWAAGKDLQPGKIPESVYWLVDGGRYVGAVAIRHYLTEALVKRGGHIGYEIRPSERKRGYGSAILRLALPKARALGIDRVLLTCDETNAASRKIIEKNGGILENKVQNSEGGPDTLRFWIDT